MQAYNFETRDFAVSDTGIHLLRSRFNYRTILFSEIKRIIIEKGKVTPNWIGAFILGTAILYGAVDLSLMTIDDFIVGKADAGSAKILVFVILIGCAGGSFIYSSVRRGIILRVSYGNDKSDKFSLKDIILRGQLADLLFMLSSKLDSRLIVKLRKSHTLRRPERPSLPPK